jgi:large subunit ribosomal protein L21e
MVKNSHGFRARTRSLMSKKVRERGLSPLSSILSEHLTGQRVDIIINSSFHKGMPHRRYQGRTGVVKGQRGRAVLVEINLGKAKKQLIVRPEHLQISKC